MTNKDAGTTLQTTLYVVTDDEIPPDNYYCDPGVIYGVYSTRKMAEKAANAVNGAVKEYILDHPPITLGPPFTLHSRMFTARCMKPFGETTLQEDYEVFSNLKEGQLFKRYEYYEAVSFESGGKAREYVLNAYDQWRANREKVHADRIERLRQAASQTGEETA